jgi:flagellar basal-body rod protein FlgC
MSIAEIGFLAAGKRLHAAASNIANACTTGRMQNSPTAPPGPAPYTPVTVQQSTDPSGGVTATVEPVSNPYVPVYDPGSPYADAQGIVGAPNVDIAKEMLNLMLARQDFEANAAVLRATNDMLKKFYETMDNQG